MSGAFRLGVVAAAGRVSGGGGGGGGGDEHFDKVAALLHFDGADGSTSFVDVTGRTWSIATGAPTISTAQSLAGGSSLDLDPTDAISSSGFAIPAPSGTDGDFCIEFFARHSGTNGRSLLTLYGDSAALLGYLYFNGTTSLKLTISGAGGFSGSFYSSTWAHVAIARSGTTLRFFIDGVQAGADFTTSLAATSATIRLGEDANITGPGAGVDGNVEDFRVTIGEARYTTNFTPPDAPFPDS